MHSSTARGFSISVALCALAAVVGPASSAQAAELGGTGAELSCGVDEFIDFGAASTVQPGQAGVVTSFRYQSDAGHAGAAFDLNVLRRVGGFDYRVVGRSGTVVDPGDGAVHAVTASIAVQPGDRLGVFNDTAGWSCLRDDEGGGGAVAVASASTDPVVGDVVTTDDEDDELSVNLAATIDVGTQAAPAIISGTGTTARGASFAFDVHGPPSAPMGTAAIGDVSGTVSCVGLRPAGRGGAFGDRAVLGIRTAGPNPRYVEFLLQDSPQAGDRIVRTGTIRAHEHHAPPSGCYHAVPTAVQRRNRIAAGDVAVTPPAG